MLGKLIKHEFKSTYRIFVPIYIGLALLIAAACLFIELLKHYNSAPLTIISGFGIILLVFGIIFVFISPYIFLSMRFYKTTATREAYLTFTVPAETHQILLGKFIVSFLWTVITLILSYFSIAIICSTGGANIKDMFNFMFDGDMELIAIQGISFLLSCALSILQIFTAISLGQLVRDHRIIASLAFYAALYTVQQIISVVVLLPFMITEMSKGMSTGIDTFSMSLGTNTDGMPVSIFLLSIIISVVFSVVFFFLSNYILKKKLNLL